MKPAPALTLDNRTPVPKYRQIVEGILGMIRSGALTKGDRIPSLNVLCQRHGLSQDTVLMAYNELKSRGIVSATVGKGYFVENANVDVTHRVFLLFDKLAPYKETLYEAFKQSLKGRGSERLYFHYNDPAIFRTLIESAAGHYTDYVVMPLPVRSAASTVGLLPLKRTFMLDQGRARFGPRYPGIYQNFRVDIQTVLSTVVPTIRKYHRLVLVLRHRKAHFNEIAGGFKSFCDEHHLRHTIIGPLDARDVQKRTAYIVVDDHDLVTLVKQAHTLGAVLGGEIGVISYNESPLKEVIGGGITTISTDFAQMGRSLAEMIIGGKRTCKDNPFTITRRESF